VRVPRSQTRARVPDAPQRAICLRRQSPEATSYVAGEVVANDRTCPTCGEPVLLIAFADGELAAYDEPQASPRWIYLPHSATCGTAQPDRDASPSSGYEPEGD
jgi:hypothetical protein